MQELILVTVESIKCKCEYKLSLSVTLACLSVVALAKSGPESDSGCVPLRGAYQNDNLILSLSSYTIDILILI
jgi:hypothetical protein